MKNGLFISHEAISKREAVKFKELVEKFGNGLPVFLTSDWLSLEAGAPWFTPLVEELREAQHLAVLITRPEAFKNPWINFEIGVGFGSKKYPKMFVFGGVPWDGIPHPISGLQLIDTGDTNRLVRELGAFGLRWDKGAQAQFAELFRQDQTPTPTVVEG